MRRGVDTGRRHSRPGRLQTRCRPYSHSTGTGRLRRRSLSMNDTAARRVEISVNGKKIAIAADPATRLTTVLRDHLGLMGTKVGCNAGDCGACTILLENDRPVCACLLSLGRVEGRNITTLEGWPAALPLAARLQASFLRHGAVQCGFCTPAMLIAATALLLANKEPTESDVIDAIGGVLCRCTGYRK